MLNEFVTFSKGVDKVNQSNAFYTFPHRSLKWYKTIIYWLLEIAVTNAYYLYRRILGDEAMGILDFRLYLIDAFQEEQIQSTSKIEEFNQLQCNLGHDDKYSRGSCAYCSESKNTSWLCVQCKKHVCPECFGQHMREAFKIFLRENTRIKV
jgi:hypothetical protein